MKGDHRILFQFMKNIIFQNQEKEKVRKLKSLSRNKINKRMRKNLKIRKSKRMKVRINNLQIFLRN